MEIRAAVIRLKPGSRARVKAWAEMINSRREEALATLVDEGVYLESWFMFTEGGVDFLICYMRAESFERAESAVKASIHEIDAYHQTFKKETWESGQVAELLVDLEVTANPNHS